VAGGEQEVAVAIAPGADELYVLQKGVEGGAILVFRDVEEVRYEERRLRQRGRTADVDGPAVQSRGLAVADEELA
jgi:hypothetical protein